MELDELKAGWQSLDQRLARVEAGYLADHRRRGGAGVRAELRPLLVGQVVQLSAAGALAIWAARFWVAHHTTPGLLAAGVLVHLYALSMLVAAVRNVVLIARVDASAPVLALQGQVATLRAWRIREGRWFGVAGCFLWVPLLVCAFGLAGVDIVTVNPGYVALNLLASVACLAVFVIMARRSRHPGGRAVHRAHERLDELARFLADGDGA